MLNPAQSARFFAPLSIAAKYPRSMVGERVQRTGGLHGAGLSLPSTFVFTREFFARLGEESDTLQQLRRMTSKVHWSNPEHVEQEAARCQDLIRALRAPSDLEHVFGQWYIQHLDGEYWALRPSLILPAHSVDHLSITAVSGEMNLWESLLEVWAKLYAPEFLPYRARELMTAHSVPMAIMVQRMIPADTSGYAILDLAQQRLDLYSTWGILPHQDTPERLLDHFSVSLKHQTIREEFIAIKPERYVLATDTLKTKPIPRASQAIPSLSEQQIRHCFLALQPLLKETSREPLRIEWGRTPQAFFVFSVEYVPRETRADAQAAAQQERSRDESPAASAVKLDDPTWISLERTIRLHHVHPIYALRHHPHEFHQECLTELTAELKTQSANVIFFQSHNLASNELMTLDHGREFEHPGENPAYGYRGGVRLLRSPEWLDFELDLIHDLHEQTHADIRYVIPNIRTFPEIHLLGEHVRRLPKQQSYVPPLWLLCQTPITITHLSILTRTPIAGVVIDLDALHQSWYGLDPSDHDVLTLYPTDASLLEWIIDHTCQVAHQAGVGVVLRGQHLSRDLEERARERGALGVIRPKPFASED